MQENLARGLSTVSRAVSSRATLPVLANVLLRTEDGGLKLTATNLEIAITAWVPGKIDADGSLMGTYRKAHIPESPGYHEKFYFSPGDTGFNSARNFSSSSYQPWE